MCRQQILIVSNLFVSKSFEAKTLKFAVPLMRREALYADSKF